MFVEKIEKVIKSQKITHADSDAISRKNNFVLNNL